MGEPQDNRQILRAFVNISKITIKTLSSFFYIGRLPFIPGTFGSVAGVALYYLVKDNIYIYASFTLFLIVLGLLISGQTERMLGEKDASCIVIDEVSGMLLSLMLIPYDIKLVIMAFCLFRILDALKPYPAGPLQDLKGSIGIMGDDIVAGLYTNIILQVVLRLTSFNAS